VPTAYSSHLTLEVAMRHRALGLKGYLIMIGAFVLGLCAPIVMLALL